MPRDVSRLDKFLYFDKDKWLDENTSHLTKSDFDFIKTMKTKKQYQEGEIMKGKSDLKKLPDGKFGIDTELDIKKGLEPKVKKALKKSIKQEIDDKLKGSGIRKIDLDLSSDDEKPMKGRGRPKKDDDIKEYGKVIDHLMKHIKDPKEPIDDDDFKQAIELIKKIKSKKSKK
jgi:hypothetical protein